jgi:hypothetical protein
MRYFIDTEFHEGFHKPLFGRRRHFIDLISIGIFAEDGREYYAISNDFDLKAAWNNLWLREYVLRPIYVEHWAEGHTPNPFSRSSFQDFIMDMECISKPNEQIAQEIKAFVNHGVGKPEFYGYYADYDWVVFCSLFGRMIDLPEGFPMYCRDLKQMLDEKAEHYSIDIPRSMLLDMIKSRPDYPKNSNEHNALADARWNYDLYQFILKFDEL